jgi:WD40 repeat protein
MRINHLLLVLGLTTLTVVSHACTNADDLDKPPPTSTHTPASVTPQASSTNTPTYVPPFTSTSIPPTPKSTNTTTPYPTLSSEGPFLFYRAPEVHDFGGPFVILDTFGGRQLITLPETGRVEFLDAAVSPDGKWLAFHVGSFWEDEPSTFTLHLMYIPDGSTHQVASLILPDYPENLSPLAEMMLAANLNDPNCLYVSCWIDPVERAFITGIEAVAWSPDGRFLAFSAQLEGPSSDLYLYELETGVITRLSDDTENINTIEWSPDGKWIVFTNTIPGQIYESFTLHAVKPDSVPNGSPAILESGWWIWEGWLSPEQVLIADIGGSGSRPFNLRTLNINSGQSVVFWPDEYWAASFDPQNKFFAVILKEPGTLDNATYIVKLDGSKYEINEKTFLSPLKYLNGTQSRFIGMTDMGVAVINIDGSVTYIRDDPNIGSILISPDNRLFTLALDGKVEIYDVNHQLIQIVDDLGNERWGPNSSTLYFFSDQEIFKMSIDDSEIELFYQCEPDEPSLCPGLYSQVIWRPVYRP